MQISTGLPRPYPFALREPQRHQKLQCKASIDSRMLSSSVTSPWLTSTRCACLGGSGSHNGGSVPTPACFLLMQLPHVRLSANQQQKTTSKCTLRPSPSISGITLAQFAEGLHFSAFHFVWWQKHGNRWRNRQRHTHALSEFQVYHVPTDLLLLSNLAVQSACLYEFATQAMTAGSST